MNDKKCFIDTNVLIYVLSMEEEKKNVALKLCKHNAVISINVLNDIQMYAEKNSIGRFHLFVKI